MLTPDNDLSKLGRPPSFEGKAEDFPEWKCQVMAYLSLLDARVTGMLRTSEQEAQ